MVPDLFGSHQLAMTVYLGLYVLTTFTTISSHLLCLPTAHERLYSFFFFFYISGVWCCSNWLIYRVVYCTTWGPSIKL